MASARRTWHPPFLLLLATLLTGLLTGLLAVLPGAPALAQEAPPPAAAETATPEDVQRLLTTLEDPAAREALTAQLRALLQAQQAAEPPAETFGARLLTLLSLKVEQMGRQIGHLGRAVLDLPDALSWLDRQVRDPRLRAVWQRLALELLLVLAAGYAARMLTLLLVRRPRAAMGARPPASALAMVPPVAGKTLLELLPVAAFMVAGIGVLSLTEPQKVVRLAAIAFLNASLAVQIIMVTARLFLSPDLPHLRLVGLSDETAHYLTIWVRRLAFTGLYGYFLAQVALLLGLDREAFAGLLKLVGLVVTALLVVLILQNRRDVADWLRGPAPGDGAPDPRDADLAALMGGEVPAAQAPRRSGRALAATRRWLADIWHVLAILYLTVSYGILALDIEGGFAFVLRATLATAGILVLARLLAAGIDRAVHRGFAVPADLQRQYPELEARANRYLPVFSRVLKGVVWLLAALAVLQAWGLDGLELLATPFGQRVSSAFFTILLVVVLALVVWELINGAIERYLKAVGPDGKPLPRTPRMRTLLPLLRNAAMVILLTLSGLTVLSELGVNIAPLLAGAGVVGLAVGFGAQTLVKDVITGLFILFEDTIAVGDVVNVGGIGGLVETITIRTIRLRDYSGVVHTIPFSAVTSVSNLTKEFSYYVFDVGVGYGEDPDRVIRVLRELGDEMRADPAFAPLILAPLDVAGVDAFLDSAVVIKARIKTMPIQQWTVGREFNRRMKQRFDELGIEIPFPQRTVHIVGDTGDEDTRKLAAQAGATD